VDINLHCIFQFKCERLEIGGPSMCGIFATTVPDKWWAHRDRILQQLSHRGPDDAHWQRAHGGVLLANTRLAIIGLGSEGEQPATSPEGSVSLVLNGEIYNYGELSAANRLGATRSDTKVLAAIVAERDVSKLGELRGMYAFVAWDSRDSSLLAMRDPFGIKPLYLLQHPGGGITLCSEIPPLLLCPEARSVDPLGIGQFLAVGHTGGTGTMFQQIHKLDPGSLYTWTREPTGTYLLRIQRPVPAISHNNLSLKEVLKDSVDAHMIADVEIGGFLSSGIDSTLLCALASKQARGMRTYTLSFPETDLDESEMAAHNASLMGTQHTTMRVSNSEMAASASDLVRIHGEPFGDGAVLPLALLARRASEEVKVVLTGEGADELFGGYARYRVSRLFGRSTQALRPLSRRFAAKWSLKRNCEARARLIEALLWGGGIRSHMALLDGDLPTLERERPSTAQDVLNMLSADWERVTQDTTDLSRALSYDRLCWLPNTYLEKTDRATMMSSLEARVPYLDQHVLSVIEAHDLRFHAKRELRETLHSVLPDVQLPNHKLGLRMNLDAVLRLPDLADPLNHELNSGDSILAAWLQGRSPDHLIQRCRVSRSFAFRVAMLGVWDREFFPFSTA
jgi:asparagine synthase (glutamine-hydrolysing)